MFLRIMSSFHFWELTSNSLICVKIKQNRHIAKFEILIEQCSRARVPGNPWVPEQCLVASSGTLQETLEIPLGLDNTQ